MLQGQKQPPEVFYKKGVLKNFAKFPGKHLCQSLFFNKAAGLPGTLLKKILWHRCFPVNFTKFSRIYFLQNTSGQLLLKGFTYDKHYVLSVNMRNLNEKQFFKKLNLSFKVKLALFISLNLIKRT